jgi:DNA-binding SARP family transcriptional activator
VAGAAVVAESEPAARLRVLALGPVEVWRDGVLVPGDAWRSAKMKELLLHLLTCPEGRTREQIGLVFWPDASAAQVKNNFHVTLHHLRKALGGAEWIVFEDDRYRVNWSLGVAFDAARFEADVVAATRAVAGGGAALTSGVERLRAALAPYRGDFLEQEGAGDWHLERRDHLRRLFNDGSLALGARLEEAESHVEAADVYRRLVLADPLAEEACRRLMTCLARDGRRTEAMRHYERLAALLRADLDAEPEASTTALYDRLRRATAV